MDNKGIPRSHDAPSSYEHAPQTSRRSTRKPVKKSQNVLCDNRGHHPPNQEHPLFNNRSLSMLSTMHHLNPHRKVAMSPEILREAEEQASNLRKAVKQLQDQLEKTNREKARIHRFLSDLLYTLNARGYESVQDHEGTVVDLNKCKGESYLELKGRDLKQRVNVRRQGGQELLMKAVIGNQERAIQSLIYKLDSIGRDMILGNRLNIDDPDGSVGGHAKENAKIASLEAEVLQLVNMIEGACQRCPEMYSALREHYYLNDLNEGSDLSPRNPVIHNLLRKCEQIANDAQSRQLVDMLIEGSKGKPRGQQNIPPPPNNTNNNSAGPGLAPTNQGQLPGKIMKNSTAKPPSNSAKQKSPSLGVRVTRSMSNEMGSMLPNSSTPTWPQTDLLSGLPLTNEDHNHNNNNCLKPLNGASNRPDNSLKHKGISIRFPRSSHPSGLNHGNNEGNNNDPYGNVTSRECSVTVCPYCHRRFGLEESISEIKSHIEMHIFAGDSTLL